MVDRAIVLAEDRIGAHQVVTGRHILRIPFQDALAVLDGSPREGGVIRQVAQLEECLGQHTGMERIHLGSQFLRPVIVPD